MLHLELDRRPCPRRRGMALISAIALTIVMGVMVLAFVGVALNSSSQTDSQEDAFRLRSAAESATILALDNLWTGFLQAGGGAAGTLDTFRQHLDAVGIAAQPMEISGNLNLPAGGSSASALGAVNVQTIWATRVDDADTTRLMFTTTVSSQRGDSPASNPVARAVETTYVAENSVWPGFDYALLANNVNCIMCHAEFKSTELAYNVDPALFGTFDRVKIGTLESLLLRSSADSTLMGSLHARGNATTKSGSLITDWSAQTLKAVALDSYGKIVQDPSLGTPTIVDLVPELSGSALGNLYLDYELDPTKMVDGYLPEDFPSPFPDDGGYDPVTGGPIVAAAGNRTVDPSEFYAAAQNLIGSLSGGVISISSPGSTIDTSAALSTAQQTGNAFSLGSSTTGNVFLTGTQANPILLNGDVAIDGDLVISGYVKGKGTLTVSGNVYVPTDLQYLDDTSSGARKYSQAPDGTENSLGIASGGSVIVGDLFFKKGGGLVTGDNDGEFGFVLSEIALFNRGEWMKTQAVLPGSGEDLSDPSTWTKGNPGFRGPAYVPRYYGFSDGTTIPIFNTDGYFDGTSWIGKEHSSKWDASNNYMDPGDSSDPYLFDASGNLKASVHALTGTDGWITDAMLRSMMSAAIAARSQGEPLRIDGLLYSNNSIFGIVGTGTPMEGQMIVNGALVAADVGLLVPGNGGTGLELNYDQRSRTMLKIQTKGAVTIRRKLWKIAAP